MLTCLSMRWCANNQRRLGRAVHKRCDSFLEPCIMQALPTLPMHHATTVNIAHASPQHCSCITTTLLMQHTTTTLPMYLRYSRFAFTVQGLNTVCMSHHVKVCDWPKVPSSCWSRGREAEGRAATAFSSCAIGKGA